MVHIFGCFEATEALGALSEFTLAAFHNIGALFQGASARTSFSIPYKPKRLFVDLAWFGTGKAPPPFFEVVYTYNKVKKKKKYIDMYIYIHLYLDPS